MTLKRAHIILVGCGKMGGALLRGWQNAKIDASYTVIEPGPLPPEFKNIAHLPAANAEIAGADMIVLAVKPQVLREVCVALKLHIGDKAPVLSIAAGQSLAALTGNFSAAQPVIRSMPNTPAAIGKGITVAVANVHVKPDQKILAETLLAAAGQVLWTDDESLLNAVTALSGSGPAYVFYLIETLAKAGEAAGLSPLMAMTLARQTVIGSAALAEHEPETTAAQLRKNVTSPGGTTEAALKILMNGEMEELFKKALLAAKKRGEELNS